MSELTPEELADRKAKSDYYTHELAERHFEYRIRFQDRVLLVADGETYDQVKKKFPKSEGYIHEGRELTPWLPAKEAAAALLPLRSLMWDILERDAAEYERNAAAQKALAERTGNRVAMDVWPVYKEVAENMRRIVSSWRDNY